jgi:hypothetical protein
LREPLQAFRLESADLATTWNKAVDTRFENAQGTLRALHRTVVSSILAGSREIGNPTPAAS